MCRASVPALLPETWLQAGGQPRRSSVATTVRRRVCSSGRLNGLPCGASRKRVRVTCMPGSNAAARPLRRSSRVGRSCRPARVARTCWDRKRSTRRRSTIRRTGSCSKPRRRAPCRGSPPAARRLVRLLRHKNRSHARPSASGRRFGCTRNHRCLGCHSKWRRKTSSYRRTRPRRRPDPSCSCRCTSWPFACKRISIRQRSSSRRRGR